MGTGFTAAEEKLFFKTADTVHRQLEQTHDAGALLAVVRQAFDGFDKAYDSAPAAAKATVACRAGCDTCCHERVAAQAHEVLIAAEHVQKHFSAQELEALIARAAAHRAAFEARAPGDPTPMRTPCVLLSNGNCSIYASRPESCRSHHSHSVEGCRSNLAAGREETDVYVRGVRGRMFAVMLGIDQAVEEVGFDDQAYDFGSALHEALTNSLCAIRWQRREQAFPSSCLETPVE